MPKFDYKPCILIVEDDEDIREFLIKDLIEISNNIHQAQDGQEALDILEKTIPDVIISDIRMPNVDGIELLQALRDRGKNIPFVILSAYGDKLVTQTALKLGAFDFVAKPYQREKLFDVMANAIALAREQNRTPPSTGDSPAKKIEEFRERMAHMRSEMRRYKPKGDK